MKLFGTDVKKIEKGYFGIRKCENCKALKDVDLVEMQGKERIFCVPIKNLGSRRFLVCKDCGAAFEITEDLWNYYQQYEYRFDKSTTDEVIRTLDEITKDLNSNNINLSFKDKSSEQSINLIYHNLCKKFNNPENISELISVYFSAQ